MNAAVIQLANKAVHMAAEGAANVTATRGGVSPPRWHVGGLPGSRAVSLVRLEGPHTDRERRPQTCRSFSRATEATFPGREDDGPSGLTDILTDDTNTFMGVAPAK